MHNPTNRNGHGRDHYQHNLLGELHGHDDDRHSHDRDVDDGPEPAHELHAPGHDTKRHVGDPNVRRDRQPDLQRDRRRQLHAADSRPAGQLHAGERDQPAHRDGHGRDHYQHDLLGELHGHDDDRHPDDHDHHHRPEPAHQLQPPGHDRRRPDGDPGHSDERDLDLPRDPHGQLPGAADALHRGRQLHRDERQPPDRERARRRDDRHLHRELYHRHDHDQEPDHGLEPRPRRLRGHRDRLGRYAGTRHYGDEWERDW